MFERIKTEKGECEFSPSELGGFLYIFTELNPTGKPGKSKGEPSSEMNVFYPWWLIVNAITAEWVILLLICELRISHGFREPCRNSTHEKSHGNTAQRIFLPSPGFIMTWVPLKNVIISLWLLLHNYYKYVTQRLSLICAFWQFFPEYFHNLSLDFLKNIAGKRVIFHHQHSPQNTGSSLHRPGSWDSLEIRAIGGATGGRGRKLNFLTKRRREARRSFKFWIPSLFLCGDNLFSPGNGRAGNEPKILQLAEIFSRNFKSFVPVKILLFKSLWMAMVSSLSTTQQNTSGQIGSQLPKLCFSSWARAFRIERYLWASPSLAILTTKVKMILILHYEVLMIEDVREDC